MLFHHDNIDGRVSILKHQTMTAMDQVKKLAPLSKKVSSLEDQMSVLVADCGAVLM
jgi:hypothetical protein